MNVLAKTQEYIIQQIDKLENRFLNGLNDFQEKTTKDIAKIKSSNTEEILKRLKNNEETVSKVQESPTVEPNQTREVIKKKMLIVEDSLSRNLNMSVVKNVTDMSVKRVESFIVSKDDPKARVPTKNFEEIVPNELSVDKYTTLVLQGGTNEISNLDVSGDVGTKIEAMKNEVKVSTSKLYSIAEKSLEENPTLEQVIILKRIFRCDPKNRDPLGMKSQLSEYGNNLLDELWMTRGCPQNIKIEKQALECDGELRVARFGLPSANGYDGTHFRGEMAVQHYTASMLNVLLDVFSVNPSDKINLQPNPNTNRNPPQYARTPLGQNVPPMHKSKLRNPAQTQ